MPDAYTYISKPTDATYTNVSRSLSDYPQYGTALYGSAKYGIQNAYTNVAKPTGETNKVILAGMATGLLISFTYATSHDVGSTQYTKIPKPTT